MLFKSFCFFQFEAQTIKVGSLQYGSVNWELKLIKELKLDKKNNFNLEIIELASKNAAVALQGGAVDLIVTDWFWVSRQRNEGRLFSFCSSLHGCWWTDHAKRF